MKNDLIIVIGAFGSGKSEYAINLALKFKELGEDVSLIDMDVVNPYFRSRDVRDDFTNRGVEVISPDGEYGHADLPMISPRIAGAIQNQSKTVILDVGGDPAGCRTLGRFIKNIEQRGYKMHFVVNTLRPFTSNSEEIIDMMKMLETASSLKISEIIANINLMNETTPQMVKNGIEIVEEVAQQKKIKFDTYLVIEDNQELIEDNIYGKKKVVLNYFLRKPWEVVQRIGI
ncbi:MAG: hypothetical protein K0B81_01445 [Candidatus Cloacimonetes bacterium]|nr:hypothetical protein [Candidatus Cloacimonadota bacterium]